MCAKHAPQGNILLYAMVLVSFFMTAAVPISIWVTTALQQSRLQRSAIAAGYLAESAAENALYALRQTSWEGSRPVPGFNLTHNLELGSVTGSLATSTPTLNFDLAAEDTSAVDLMNEDVLGANGIYSLRVALPADSPATGWLEVQWVTWRPGEAWSDGAMSERLFSPNELKVAGGQVIPLAGSTGVAYAYRIKFKARYGALDDLTVTAYNDLAASGSSVPLPLITSIITTGRVDRATQRLEVRAPRRTPLYGLFDYAVFSETEVTK